MATVFFFFLKDERKKWPKKRKDPPCENKILKIMMLIDMYCKECSHVRLLLHIVSVFR